MTEQPGTPAMDAMQKREATMFTGRANL
jgi:hypothetical protein